MGGKHAIPINVLITNTGTVEVPELRPNVDYIVCFKRPVVLTVPICSRPTSARAMAPGRFQLTRTGETVDM
jgi:hypothetical protein